MADTIAFMLTGDKLRALRAMRGISQAELAERAGVAPASIASFETGKSDIRASTIRKLCEALNVKVVYKIDSTELSGP